jgi:putative ABC transport system permease protein
MNWFSELWRRLEYLFRRKRLEADLAEEMRTHLDLRAAERAGAEVPPDEAQAQARRRFGNVTQLQEAGRETWGWAWFDSLVQDVRYGLRTLASHPGFTLTAVLSLALGIGANTAIFTILNAVMLRSLPVEDPQRLAEVRSDKNSYFTNPIWEHIRDHQQMFSGMLAYSDNRFDLAEGGESRFAQGVWVSGDYFNVLGVPALRGRVFTQEDDRHGGGKSGPVAVISYSFWQGHFGGDPSVIGRTIKLDRHPFEIVGVTPPWFTGLNVDRGFEVAVPIGCEPILNTDRSALDQRSWWWLRIMGRLGPGTSIQQADAGMKTLAPELNRATLPPAWEPRDQKEYLARSFELRPAATGFSDTGSRYRDALFTLMAVVGLVLLIACANIANLLLARASARQREISIRLAIGAGRGRVIRQLLTESLLLSLLGAAGGLLLARWGSTLLVTLLSTSRDPLELDLAPDGHVLAFTIGVAVVTGVLFGLAPAFRATSISPNQVLKEHARGSITGGSRFRLGQALVAGQVALSLLLLVGAGLFLGTMRNLLNVPAGFDRHNVLLVRAATVQKVPKEQRNELYRALLERLRSVPGVISASNSQMTPISGMVWNEFIYPEGFQAKSREDGLTYFNRVSPGYFRTLGTPLLAGRDFEERDTLSSPKVMILNETAARRYFGGASPVGKTAGMNVEGKPGVKATYEIIGVVGDAKYVQLHEETLPTGFVPMAQDPDPWPEATFEVRSSGNVEALTPSIRSAVAEVNPGISLVFSNFNTQVNDSLTEKRTVALLSSFFGALALLLAMIGLYGVTSYAVLRRQSEIGIRMALGASQRTVVWLVLRHVVTTLAIGTLVGIAAAIAAGRLVASLLFGVKPADPATIAAAALILAASTALAAYLPARRASLLDPTTALRDE